MTVITILQMPAGFLHRDSLEKLDRRRALASATVS
jgi:hypothetical protein